MKLPRFHSTLLATVLAGLTLATPGMRAQADPLGVIAGETLDITADKLDLDVSKGTALLDGNVKAKLGELTVECNKVEMKYDGAPKVEWAKGTGGVKASYRDVFAKAQAVEVDVVRRTVTLSNGVHLSRGKGWVTADKATLDLVTRKVSLADVKGSIPVQTPAR